MPCNAAKKQEKSLLYTQHEERAHRATEGPRGKAPGSVRRKREGGENTQGPLLWFPWEELVREQSGLELAGMDNFSGL